MRRRCIAKWRLADALSGDASTTYLSRALGHHVRADAHGSTKQLAKIGMTWLSERRLEESEVVMRILLRNNQANYRVVRIETTNAFHRASPSLEMLLGPRLV